MAATKIWYRWARDCAAGLQDLRRPDRTLVHGDLKAARIISPDRNRSAVYGFQLVGKGLGVVDVAYVLSTSVKDHVLCDSDAVAQLLEYTTKNSSTTCLLPRSNPHLPRPPRICGG